LKSRNTYRFAVGCGHPVPRKKILSIYEVSRVKKGDRIGVPLSVVVD